MTVYLTFGWNDRCVKNLFKIKQFIQYISTSFFLPTFLSLLYRSITFSLHANDSLVRSFISLFNWLNYLSILRISPFIFIFFSCAASDKHALLTRNCLRSDETNARNSVWFEAGQSPCSVSVPEPSVVRPLDCWKKEINELPRSPNKTSIICAGVAQFVTQDCACLILFDAASTQLRRPGSMVVRKTGRC